MRTTTSPWASMPSVTLFTENSVSSFSMPTRALIALYVASTGPVPVAVCRSVRPADLARVHDLVGLAHLEDAVLVDAGLVTEGVAADDRLVRLHHHAREVGDEPRRAVEL